MNISEISKNNFRKSCFIACLYMYSHWRSSHQEGKVAIPLTSLTLPHFCACHKPGPGFPTSHFMVFFVFNELRWEVIVHWLILVELLTITTVFKHSFHNLISRLDINCGLSIEQPSLTSFYSNFFHNKV